MSIYSDCARKAALATAGSTEPGAYVRELCGAIQAEVTSKVEATKAAVAKAAAAKTVRT
jgi:hypothetical protein